MRIDRLLTYLLFAVALVAAGGYAQALPLFSADTGSAVPSDSDLYHPSLVVVIPDQNLGIQVPGNVDLDAVTYQYEPITLFFSVERAAVGAPGTAVAGQAAVGQAAGDIYTTNLAGANTLVYNQDVLSLSPNIPAGQLYVPPPQIDDLDALDLAHSDPVAQPTPGMPPPQFTLIAGNVFGVSGADILVAGPAPAGPPIVWVPEANLGLGTLGPGDDIDGLHYDGIGYFFSLTPGSPSLAAGVCGGTSAADIFYSAGGGACVLWNPAPALGLLVTDDVDAISFVPEPSTLLLVGFGAVSLVVCGRRKMKR
jgi:hypothetical protein